MCGKKYIEEIKLIGGDDFAFEVEFTFDDETAALSEGDTVEAIIHDGDEEIILPSKPIKGNIAPFYLSGEFTASLMKNENASYYEFCVRINRANGEKHTPIHRFPLIVRRC